MLNKLKLGLSALAVIVATSCSPFFPTPTQWDNPAPEKRSVEERVFVKQPDCFCAAHDTVSTFDNWEVGQTKYLISPIDPPKVHPSVEVEEGCYERSDPHAIFHYREIELDSVTVIGSKGVQKFPIDAHVYTESEFPQNPQNLYEIKSMYR